MILMFRRWSLLGLILEVFWEPKWRPRASKRGSQKSLKIRSNKCSFFDQFWGPFGVQNGAQHGLKTDLGSSRGSRGSQGSILEGFWTNFRAILGWFFEGFWTYINARTHCVESACFFVLGEVVGDIGVLLPSFWIWFGGGMVRCSSCFFICLSMPGFIIVKWLLSCVETWWELRLGLLWCVWFADLRSASLDLVCLV